MADVSLEAPGLVDVPVPPKELELPLLELPRFLGLVEDGDVLGDDAACFGGAGFSARSAIFGAAAASR